MICLLYRLSANINLLGFNINFRFFFFLFFYSRRILYEDYRFDLNGRSPLTEKFLRSSRMLRNVGTQLLIPHPQIVQVPSINVETYDDDIKRAAKFCRIVRAQRHKLVIFYLLNFGHVFYF